MDKDKKNNWKAWLYLAPVLILMAIFTFFPIVSTIISSFLKDYNNVTGEETKGNYSANRTFPSTSSLNDIQDNLIEELIEEVIDQIFNATVANW